MGAVHGVALALLCAVTIPAQVTVTLIADRDNTLFEDPTGSLSNGAGIYLFAGVTGQPGIRRTLVRFPVAGSVPAGARILSASLRLNVSRSLIAAPIQVDAHRVLQAWGEGTSNGPGNEGNGTPATPGDATWLHSQFPSVFWANAGGDFDPVASGSSPTPISGTATWPSTPALVADTQRFLDQPADNFGWLLKTDGESVPTLVRRFDSREHTTASRRPRLSITYLPPGQTLPVGTGCLGSGGQTLLLAAQNAPVPGQAFALQLSRGQPGALALHAVSLRIAPSPLPVYPGCNLYLDPQPVLVTHAVLLLDGAGAAATPFPVPPGFLGVELDFQSLALDGGLAAGLVLSNALRVLAG